jgi:HlyD family secretion protein
MKSFWSKKILLWIFAVIVVLGGSYYFLVKKTNTAKTTVSAAEAVAKVTKGAINTTVSGTSQFEAKDMQTISAPSDGTIKVMNLTRNLPVKKGDLLFEINNPDLEVSLQKAQLSLAQLQKEYADLSKQQNALITKAPISGKLTYAPNIDVASQVSKTTKIATLSDPSVLTVTLPFLLEDAIQLKAGDIVDLTVEGYMLTKTGTVQKIAAAPRADVTGNKILDIAIKVENDNTLDAGIKVSGSVSLQGNTSKSLEQAVLQYVKTSTVIANTSGIIESVPFKTGDIVKQGEIISSISSDNLSNDLLVKQASIEQQQVTVNDLQEKVNSLKVTAPFDGVFSTDFVNQKTNILSKHPIGAKIDSGTAFGGVSSLDSMQLPIEVDELDLPSIKDKMQANIKVDSITNKTFKGEVNQISTVGTTTNGVTFYTVVLSVPNDGQLLKYGMTATAEILIQDKKDILTIPIEALQSRQGKRYVTLKNADGTKVSKEVTIGIRSKTQVEIVSGLKEGDTIVTTATQTRRQNLTQAQIDALRKQFQGSNGGNGGNGGNGRNGGNTRGTNGATTGGFSGGASQDFGNGSPQGN